MTVHVLDRSAVARTEVVRPAMCGHNSLLAGQIGDWTWDAVSALCNVDALRARDAGGAPTYLSFCYLRIRGSRRFHLRTPTFGDRLHAATRLFDLGSESVHALHRIARSPAHEQDRGDAIVAPEPAGFYAEPDEGCLHVESFNRWISRSDERTNRDLVRGSPVGFRHRHLATLPPERSPRLACRRARSALTFVEGDRRELGPPVDAEYRVDPARDLNGVGLLYFAAFFSIVDWALLQLWRALGRSDRAFLDRVVVDQQVCYAGNADAGSTLAASARRCALEGDDGRELVDVVLRDREDQRLLAVSTIELLREAA